MICPWLEHGDSGVEEVDGGGGDVGVFEGVGFVAIDPEVVFGGAGGFIEVDAEVEADGGVALGVDEKDGARGDGEGGVDGRKVVEIFAGLDVEEPEAQVRHKPAKWREEIAIGDGGGEGIKAVIGTIRDDGGDGLAVGGGVGGRGEQGCGPGANADAGNAAALVGILGAHPMDGAKDVVAFGGPEGDEIAAALALGAKVEDHHVVTIFDQGGGESEPAVARVEGLAAEQSGLAAPFPGAITGRGGSGGEPGAGELEAVDGGKLDGLGAEFLPGGIEGGVHAGAIGDGGDNQVGEPDGKEEGDAEELSGELAIRGLPFSVADKEKSASQMIEDEIEELEKAEKSGDPVAGEENLQGWDGAVVP